MLGSHLSVAGGPHHALEEAKRLRMETVQIFTANQRQWNPKPPGDEAVRLWREMLDDLGWSAVVSHASYLINLASPDDELFAKSVDAMTREIERCEAFGIGDAVVHPGSHRGEGEAFGLKRIAKGVNEVVRRTRGMRTRLCLETTVGSGHSLGGRFEHLARIRDGVRTPERVSTCLDTCHVTAAGYDVSTEPRAAAVFEEWDEVVGIEHLRCFHFNDSLHPLGSRRDRHAHINDGHVGRGVFIHVLGRGDFAAVPKILETPKGETEKGTPWDTINLRRLRRLAPKSPDVAASGGSSARRRRPSTARRTAGT